MEVLTVDMIKRAKKLVDNHNPKGYMIYKGLTYLFAPNKKDVPDGAVCVRLNKELMWVYPDPKVRRIGCV